MRKTKPVDSLHTHTHTHTHRRKWLSLVVLLLALFLWQCHSEDFNLAENNSKRNNSDFFKHDSSGGLTGRAGVDYVSILEDYNDEHNFLATMPDQEGMPIWGKMQVVDVDSIKTRVFIPLSYDDTTLSSVLAVAFDGNNEITSLKNVNNEMLESFVYDEENIKRDRTFWMDVFLFVDSKTFGTQNYTNLPTDLYEDVAYGEHHRLNLKGYETKAEEGKANVLTCSVAWYCKNGKMWYACDAGSGCTICWSKVTCTSIGIIDTDFPDFPPGPVTPGSNPIPGHGGGGGGTSTTNGPLPPKDPCTLGNTFYRLKPNCGGTGSGEINVLPNIDIDSSLNNSVSKCLLQKMSGDTNLTDNKITLPTNSLNDNLFQKMLRKFDGISAPKIIFKAEPLQDNHLGQTRSYDDGNELVIVINSGVNSNLFTEATFVHELVHALMLHDLQDLNMIQWDPNTGEPTLAYNVSTICQNNNFDSSNPKEHFAAVICKHLEVFQQNGQNNPQWMHELFGMSYFDTQVYADAVRDFLVSYHAWGDESADWQNVMSLQFSSNWQGTVSQYVVMDALRMTNDFQNWWGNNSMSTFNDIIYNTIEKGKLNGSTNEYPLKSNCN